MSGTDPGNSEQESSAVEALAMLIEYALIESRALRLPVVSFLLKMARNAIQGEAASNSPITIPPEVLEEAPTCPSHPSRRPPSV